MKRLKPTLLFLIFFLLLHVHSIAQNPKEIDFKKACDSVLKSISKKNVSALNSVVNKTYGVYIIYRSGVYDRYTNLKTIKRHDSFGTLVGSVFDWTTINAADLKKFSLNYGRLPEYDCENGWPKMGYIADSAKRYKPISQIVSFQAKYEETKISKKESSTIKFVEQHSRKVIFAGKEGSGLIFYMIYLNGKWYLSAIDEATTDCSA